MSEAKVCKVCGREDCGVARFGARASLMSAYEHYRLSYERERAAREKAEAERDAAIEARESAMDDAAPVGGASSVPPAAPATGNSCCDVHRAWPPWHRNSCDPARQRAQHTCNAADGSLRCRGCAAGIPYPRLPEEQAFLDALAPAQPATGRSEDEAEKLADALLGARLGPGDLVAALRAALAAAERRGLERAAVIVGSMSERPYDNEPEFSAVMACEAAIHAEIRALAAEPEKAS